ncbi:MAG: Holliday junction resolvase RuvX [Candidatus Midichloria sp.]|nr:MAG: Holliday junction resolvase RuvX [Candidatus Midichloria sp.]
MKIQQIETPIEDLLKSIKTNPNIKFLCLDFGKKKVGIATGCFDLSVSIPHKTIQYQSLEKTIDVITRICKEIGMQDVVIGIPLQDEELNDSAQYMIKFAEQLFQRSRVRIHFQDESFSSCIAINLLQCTDLKRKERDRIDDAVAASVILTNFFNRIRGYINI